MRKNDARSSVVLGMVNKPVSLAISDGMTWTRLMRACVSSFVGRGVVPEDDP